MGEALLAREKGAKPHKTRIESLSDLIFGLALSIGALTLIGQPPSDFQALVLSIAFYAFSFLILISVWYSYTRTMALLRVETDRLVSFNILLLFLVSIEPFLFNQLINFTKLLYWKFYLRYIDFLMCTIKHVKNKKVANFKRPFLQSVRKDSLSVVFHKGCTI